MDVAGIEPATPCLQNNEPTICKPLRITISTQKYELRCVSGMWLAVSRCTQTFARSLQKSLHSVALNIGDPHEAAFDRFYAYVGCSPTKLGYQERTCPITRLTRSYASYGSRARIRSFSTENAATAISMPPIALVRHGTIKE